MLRYYVYIVAGVKEQGKKRIRIEPPPFINRKLARLAREELKAQGFRTYFCRYILNSLNDKGQ